MFIKDADSLSVFLTEMVKEGILDSAQDNYWLA
jgi:hypothetical protein